MSGRETSLALAKHIIRGEGWTITGNDRFGYRVRQANDKRKMTRAQLHEFAGVGDDLAPDRHQRLLMSQVQTLVQQHIAAERFATWLALAPILDDMAELNRDNDDGDVTGYEVRLFLQRIHARLEAIGQGLHRFDGEAS